MPLYRSRVVVTLRKSILDPQGKAVEHAVHTLGLGAISNIRIGKNIEFTIDARDAAEAERLTRDACSKLLANPVMEDFTVEVTKV